MNKCRLSFFLFKKSPVVLSLFLLLDGQMINFTGRFIMSLISVTRIMSFSDIIGFSDNRFL